MTLIWVGDVPTVISSAETNPTLLRDALSETTVSGGSANWQAAFALASGAAQGYREAKIVIVSDGGIETETAILPVEAVYIPIGEAAENVAITALASVEVSNEIDGTQVFARVANTGLGEQSTLLSLFLGNQLFDSRQLTVPAGETVSITFEIPSETAVSDITARLSEQTVDYLPADDVAYAIHEGGVSNRTLLVTDGNLFLEQLLSSIPGIELFKTDDPSGDNSQFDLVVLDQAPLPEGVEAADILWIAPPESDDVITVSGVFTNTATTRIEDDPILTFVDWGGVDVLQAQNVSAGFLRPLITAQGGDLLSVGSQNNRRIAVISFDLLQSDLPLQVAFPILISNLTEWLNPGAVIDAPSGMHVGASVPLAPPAGVERIVITKPDGSVYRADVGDEQLIFSETQASGLYIIETETGLRTTQAGAFAVNLFAESESTIAPQETVQVGFSDLTEETEEAVGQREFWPWLALLALLILVIEWWVYHRGTVLPKLSLPRRT